MNLCCLHAASDIQFERADALTWMAQVAAALCYMHAVQPRPVLHRNLKPANILLFDDRRIVKLANFGLTRVIQTEMPHHVLSYMAPEVCLCNITSNSMCRHSPVQTTRLLVMCTRCRFVYGKCSVDNGHTRTLLRLWWRLRCQFTNAGQVQCRWMRAVS